jgi:tetratricopeptide (TPR) repeat protein
MSPWLLGAGLAILIAVVYFPVWHAGFVWDDDAHLTANRCIVGPLGFKEIWTTAEANYFPLVLTHLWVLHAIFGLNPLPYHLATLVLHIVNAILLWQVLRRLGVRGAWLGAAFWALHPVQVESVAWISELKNTQSGVFFLLAVWFFAAWVQADPSAPRRKWRYGLALGCGVLAILSKPSTVMLPLVLGLCTWWLRGELRWYDARGLLPFFFLSAAASGWTVWEQKVHSLAHGPEWNQTLPERAVIAGRAAWFYLRTLAWPHPMSFIHPRWSIDATRLTAWFPLLALGAVGLALWWRRTGPARPVGVALAYFLVSLFPVLGFFDVYFFRFSFVADHFQYLASMSICALAAAALHPVRLGRTGAARWAVPAALVGSAALVAHGEVRVYRDNVTLWETTKARNPNAWLAYNNLAIEYTQRERWDDARAHYEQGLRLYQGDAELHSNYGIALLREGRRDEAIREFEAALRLKPQLAVALNALSVVCLQTGDVARAIDFGQRAVRSDPAYPVALFNLGNALGRAQRRPEAEAAYRQAIALKPGFVEAWINLGTSAFAAGEHGAAATALAEAVRLQPGSPEARNSLGAALTELGRYAEAAAHLGAALQVRPEFRQAHTNLAVALLRAGDRAGAIRHHDAALRLDPSDAAVRARLDELQKQVSPAGR